LMIVRMASSKAFPPRAEDLDLLTPYPVSEPWYVKSNIVFF